MKSSYLLKDTSSPFISSPSDFKIFYIYNINIDAL